MRHVSLFLIFLFLIVLQGCQLLTEPAPLLEQPKEPKLQTHTAILHYEAPMAPLQIKSVQLPAHPLKNGQTVMLADKNIHSDSELAQLLATKLNEIGLTLIHSSQADYKLTLTKMELLPGNTTDFKLQVQPTKQPFIQQEMDNNPVKHCATLKGNIGFRLTHLESGDIVWFAKARADTTTLGEHILTHKIILQETITNQHSIQAFIEEHNTDEARIKRAHQPVTIPKYKLEQKATKNDKISGRCNEEEVQSLNIPLQRFLISELISKLNVI